MHALIVVKLATSQKPKQVKGHHCCKKAEKQENSDASGNERLQLAGTES